MITLAEIHAGDEVLLRDPAGNTAHGITNYDHRTDVLWIRAFAVRIEFARKTAAGWHRIAGISVLWHQPELFEARPR